MREWIVGRNPVYETLRAGRRHAFRLMLADGIKPKGNLQDAINLCKKRNIQILQGARERFNEFGSGHQGVALEVNEYPYSTLDDILVRSQKSDEPPFVLILDTLQDPQNLGALLRTAEAVGVHGVCIPPNRSAKITPSVVSASSGATEHLYVTQVNLKSAIDLLKEKDIWVIGLDGGSGASYPKDIRLDGGIALVVGNEGQGMRRLVGESCDLIMKFPMEGKVDSLNAAIAGSVALYLILQARGKM